MSRWVARVALGGYAVFVLWVTLMPRLEDVGAASLAWRLLAVVHGWGVPAWFDYAMLEFMANVAMFVPIGMFGVAILPRHRWWLAIVTAFFFSCAIELAQLWWLPDRVADGRDVLANSLGAALGAGLALGLRALRWKSVNREDAHV